MHRGNMIDRGRPGTGYDLDDQEKTQLWGQTFVSPALVTAASPALFRDEQLVQVRYPRPTTWTFTRFLELVDAQPFAIGDKVVVDWQVRIGIGQVNRAFFLEDVFTFPFGAPAQVTMQLPAKSLQVQILGVSVISAGASHFRPVLTAMVAPVVE